VTKGRNAGFETYLEHMVRFAFVVYALASCLEHGACPVMVHATQTYAVMHGSSRAHLGKVNGAAADSS